MTRLHLWTAVACTAVFFTASAAHADVVGRLHFVVKNAADEKPISGAKITLKDSAKVRPDVTLTTDARGNATSEQLEARPWQAVTEGDKPDVFQTDTRTVTVANDVTTDVEVLLEPLTEKTVKVTANRETVNKGQTGTVTQRDQTFIQSVPANAGNIQNLRDVLLTVPGFAADSVNQAHPRGEHSATGIYINGFYLPGALSGRAGPLLSPTAIQNLDVLTGAYAPEYGGETAAILNLTLRSGPIVPLKELLARGGEFNTFEGELTFGGQAGRAMGQPDASGYVARKFGYFVNVTGRRTDNALEPPQPDNQTAHNRGTAETFFGNFDYHLGLKDQLQLALNFAPAYTQIANRTGLPGSFAKFGQGFGYGGGLSASEAAAQGIVSQQAAGQDINQRDSNYFGVLTWRREFSTKLSSVFSLGGVSSQQNLTNHNPKVDLNNLPADSSIEFGPTLLRDYQHIQPQGSITYNEGKHTVKTGFLFDAQSGDESYNFVPGSQLALNALANIDLRLVGAGSFQTDANGNPVLDKNGNKVFILNPGAKAPTLNVNRSGYYAAAYAQDTWNATKRFTINYGLRFDAYRQSENLGQPAVDQANLSPRINTAYKLDTKTIFRAAYNRLFIQPPLSQGAILGEPIKPETLSQYDVSIERAVAPRQTVKLAYYIKDIRNQVDTGLLIPGTQIGAFTSVNFQRDGVHGVELSYDLLPRNNRGLAAYTNVVYSIARPSGKDNTGAQVPTFNDHDQRWTVNVGAAYTLKSGAFGGMDFYYGSGVASSPLVGDQRNDRMFINLTLSTGPRLFGKDRGGISVAIENLLDDRSLINFNSGFSGTRFQQGRRIMVSAFGKF